ncbi:MAG: hypothetical protein KAS32_24490 [Candidatus Peribacteraceae bacterium]|nr:hypothetical protein [Candidatus Peribacteraceae bacterium]
MSERDQKEVTYILSKKKQAEDAMYERRAIMDELWMLYQNKQDWSNKKAWQSKVFVPKIFMTVEQAAAVVKRAVLSTATLFSLKVRRGGKDEQQIELAKQAKAEVERRFKEFIDDTNFADSYGEMTKSSFVTGFGVPKVIWNQGLEFFNVDSKDIFVDPHFMPSQKRPPGYVIEQKTMPLAELKAMAKSTNSAAGRQVFRMAEINKIKEDSQEDKEEWKRRARRGLQPFNRVDRMVQIDEFWGDIIDPDNDTVKRNQLIWVANKSRIIRRQDNPFSHGRNPYALTSPIVYPHRGVAGVSLVEHVVAMQYALNNVTNLAIDNLNFSVNKIFEANPTSLLNPKSLTQMYPGKIVFKHGQQDAIKEVRTTGVGQDAFSVMGLLDQGIQKGTGVTDFLTGNTSKSGTTATETKIKTAQAQGMFDVIARNLEANSIRPLMEMSFALWEQFNPDLPEGVSGAYDFNVGGLSLLLQEQEQSQNLQTIIQFALSSPDISQMTDTTAAWKKFLELKDQGDLFAEQTQEPGLQDKQGIEEAAAAQAKSIVDGMSEEEILNS